MIVIAKAKIFASSIQLACNVREPSSGGVSNRAAEDGRSAEAEATPLCLFSNGGLSDELIVILGDRFVVVLISRR